jgi:hypothetical protein
MTTARFRVTYDVVSPESAEQGDTCDSGFAHPRGWKFPANDPGPHEMTLREAIEVCGFYPRARAAGMGGFEDSGSWFSTIDPDQNYQTGEDTRYSIHPPKNITAASYRRLARYLTGRK